MFIYEFYNIFLGIHRCFMCLKPFDQIDELSLIFEFSKSISLMIRNVYIVFFGFLVRMTSWCSSMMVAASLDFSILSSFSFKPSASTFSLLVKDMINCFLISSLLSFLVLLALSEPHFLNYEQKITIRL